MFNNNDKKQWNQLIMICMLFVFWVLISIALNAILFKELNIASILGMAGCVVLLAIIFMSTAIVKKKQAIIKAIGENDKETAYIQYDTNKKTAYTFGDISLLTGIDLGSDVLTEETYTKLMEEIISCRYEGEEDIYMSCCPEKWIKIKNFETGDVSLTVIRDVSSYVLNLNLIKSLRYYDSATGILSREAFTHKLRQTADAFANESTSSQIGLIHIVIVGLEKVSSFSGSAASDLVIKKISSFLKKYENPHNTFAGRTSTNEFTISVTDTYDVGCRKTAEKILTGLMNVISEFSENDRSYIRIFCGYSVFEKHEAAVGSMMAAVEFAAFDAERKKSNVPVAYDSISYAKSANEFKKIQVFNEIIEKNLINYHFQPIVNARTGEIYGYESLMRPQMIDGIKLNPLEMLTIAESQDMLDKIESRTFFNSLKILSENQDFFRDRKMFVNSISSNVLNDIEFETLYTNYGELFDKLVVEITESTKISNHTLELLKVRYKDRNALVALDDYGTGYSNESMLLKVNPNFIKIDRSILTGIDTDTQKQHLVSNMINFASQHGIKTLAEGIETNEELETVISLGIDLIQGFVTSKAMSIFLLDIPDAVRNVIVNYNLKHIGYVNKVYEIVNDTPVDIVNLALFGYTDIRIKTKTVYISGESNKCVNMRIKCDDNTDPTIYFSNVNINGLDSPVLKVGGNCNVMAVMEGENFFSFEGVRVPAASKFVISGDGNLTVNCDNNNGITIGGNYQQEIGQIVFNGTGTVNIITKGDNCIAIGGGRGNANSVIKLISGKINLDVKAANCIGIGVMTGEIAIHMHDAEINGNLLGQNVVGIGSKNADTSITSNASINLTSSGDCCCMIGTLDKCSSKIEFNFGKYDFVIHSKLCLGIGSVKGDVEMIFNAGTFDIKADGNRAKCIGSFDGRGRILIGNAVISAITHSSEELNIDIDGEIVVKSGNILTNSIVPLKAQSPFGTELVRYKVNDDNEELKISVKDKESVYVYSIILDKSLEANYAYLPKNFESDLLEYSEIEGA